MNMLRWIKRIACVGMAAVLTAGILLGSTGVQAKKKGYAFSYKKATVHMGDPAKMFLKKAGKPKKKSSAKSCAYKGKDRTYKYKDFEIYTYSNSNNGPEYVNGIALRTSKVSTKEGIRIGSSWADVKKKYGKGKDNFGIYTYKKGNSKLQIEITDDEVTNIEYIMK